MKLDLKHFMSMSLDVYKLGTEHYSVIYLICPTVPQKCPVSSMNIYKPFQHQETTIDSSIHHFGLIQSGL